MENFKQFAKQSKVEMMRQEVDVSDHSENYDMLQTDEKEKRDQELAMPVRNSKMSFGPNSQRSSPSPRKPS